MVNVFNVVLSIKSIVKLGFYVKQALVQSNIDIVHVECYIIEGRPNFSEITFQKAKLIPWTDYTIDPIFLTRDFALNAGDAAPAVSVPRELYMLIKMKLIG
jgi:hypothetical protein